MLRGVVRSSLVELIQVREDEEEVRLSEVYINPKYIMSVEDIQPSQRLMESASRIGLSPTAQFSVVHFNDNITSRRIKVVGSAKSIYLKLNNKRVLKG